MKRFVGRCVGRRDGVFHTPCRSKFAGFLSMLAALHLASAAQPVDPLAVFPKPSSFSAKPGCLAVSGFNITVNLPLGPPPPPQPQDCNFLSVGIAHRPPAPPSAPRRKPPPWAWTTALPSPRSPSWAARKATASARSRRRTRIRCNRTRTRPACRCHSSPTCLLQPFLTCARAAGRV